MCFCNVWELKERVDEEQAVQPAVLSSNGLQLEDTSLLLGLGLDSTGSVDVSTSDADRRQWLRQG